VGYSAWSAPVGKISPDAPQFVVSKEKIATKIQTTV
jgi:hypothetical protein